MEPIITVALLVGALHKVIESVASEAGQRLWTSLTDLIHRHREDAEQQPAVAAQTDLPRTESEVEELAQRLIQLMSHSPEFTADLRTWLATAEPTTSSISNTITGTVHGNAVQARDIAGPITFS
ncbi:hypothetical protein ACIA5E_05080 [Nocardia asteroides]|uniref:hypothetical protein n=1 Tax=Nocardia asteroides TaxID=1824 RepID=UPI0037BB462F